MTTHAKDLNNALNHLDSKIAERIRRYRPRRLTDEQATWWLDDVRLLAALVPPTDVEDAISMMGAGCRFLLESGADNTKPTSAWFTALRVESWLGQLVASGSTTETVRKIGFRLAYLRRASLGAPVRKYVRDRRVGVRGLTESELSDVHTRLDVHSQEFGAWLAIIAAGLHPRDLTGASFVATTDGVEVVGADGRRFAVLVEFAALAHPLVGVTLKVGAWRRMQEILRADALHVTAHSAASTFAVRAFDGRSPMVMVVRERGLGDGSLRSASRAVLATPSPCWDPQILRGAGIVSSASTGTLVSDPSVSGEPRRQRLQKRFSRAEARRRLAETQQRAATLPTLTPTASALLDGYMPTEIDATLWSELAPVHREIIARSGIVSPDAIRKARSVLAQFLAFRQSQGESLDVTKVCTVAAVDAYFARGMTDFAARTRNDYRTRLDRIVRAVNPGPDAPPKIKSKYYKVRPGYNDAEQAAMRRIAARQPRAGLKRQASAIVGLACGAGLDASDLRHLFCRQIIDQGDTGIEVTIAGTNARRVWVRREYEDLVRIGINGVSADHTLFGRGTEARNGINGVLNALVYVEKGLTFDAARMRTTWLAWLVTQPVSLRTILDVSGLQSARTLAEIIAVLPPTAPPEVRALLRGEAQ